MDSADRLSNPETKPFLPEEVTVISSSEDRTGKDSEVKRKTEENVSDIMTVMMKQKGGEEEVKSTDEVDKARFVKGKFICSYTKKPVLRASTLKLESTHRKIHNELNDGIQRKFIKKTASTWAQTPHPQTVSLIKLTHVCQNEPIEVPNSVELETASQEYQKIKASTDDKKAKLNDLNQRLENLQKMPYKEKLSKVETLSRINEPIPAIEGFLVKVDRFAEKCKNLDKLISEERQQLIEEQQQLLQEYNKLALNKVLQSTLGQTIKKLDKNFRFTGSKLAPSIDKLLKADLSEKNQANLGILIEGFERNKSAVESELAACVQQYERVKLDIQSTCPPYIVHFEAFKKGNLESFSLFVNELEQAINQTKDTDPIAYQDALTILSDALKFIQETGLLDLTRQYEKKLSEQKETAIVQQSDYETLQAYVNNLRKLLALTPDSMQQPSVDEEEDIESIVFGSNEAEVKDSSMTSKDVPKELPGGEEMPENLLPSSPSTPPSTATVTKAPLMEEKFKALLELIPSDNQEVTVKDIRAKILWFNQSKEGLVNAFKIYQNHINESLEKIRQETNQKVKFEKDADLLKQELIQLKQNKEQCLRVFVNQLERNSEKSIQQFFQKDIEHIQEFVDVFLGHYLVHSQERFPKLFETHRDFAERISEMFTLLKDQISEDDLQKLELILTEFLNQHIKLEDKKTKKSSETETVSNTTKKSNAEPAKPLYRKVQAAHEADSELLNECNRISENLQLILPWLFGKGFAVSPEAAHLVPYPGIVSWDLNYLSQLFKEKLNVTLNLEADRLALFNQNVGSFANAIQAGEKINLETVKTVLEEKLPGSENREENLTFIFNTLVFLTHLSSLEMAETRHLPEYFNQVVDKYSETEIKYGSDQGRGYKVLLGEALIDLINSPDRSQLSKKHITYLKSTLEAVSDRLKELADKKEATHKLTSLELVECHALYSIYLAVKTITEEKSLDQSILEQEELIEMSAKKITA